MFAVVFNADRKPIDHGDAGDGWSEAHVVGNARHVAFLRRNDGSPKDAETFCATSNDRRRWLAGRIRLDARHELAARLEVDGRCSDAGLVLAAYEKWDMEFVERLAGDFCLALWDDTRGHLVCARDQLGIRSLFYAKAGECWLISDSLSWIAAQPSLEREIDDVWVADFLGIGLNLDGERTVWRDVRRLAPAHAVVLGDGEPIGRRYWQLAIDEPLHYRDRRSYAEQFRELTGRAIADRLPDGRVGVSMSGGLDSPTLAACAVETTGDAARVVGECVYYKKLLPDDEHVFAAEVARQLGMELHLTSMDGAIYDPQWRTHSIHAPEPTAALVNAWPDGEISRAMANRAGVWLYGEGPDNALQFERDAYLGWLLRQRRWQQLGGAAVSLVRAKGLTGWKDTLLRYAGRVPAQPQTSSLPAWLGRDFVAEMRLDDRLAGVDEIGRVRHPWHPDAVSSFAHPVWQRLFTSFEFEESLAPLVWRHPFLDLRVLIFMLAVPPVPLARRKLLLREAMAGRLPASVLKRSKTPLSDSPLALALQGQVLPELSARRHLGRWVDVDALPCSLAEGIDPERLIAAHAFDRWLTQVAAMPARR